MTFSVYERYCDPDFAGVLQFGATISGFGMLSGLLWYLDGFGALLNSLDIL